MQSLLVCEPRRNPPASSGLARHLPAMIGLIEREWRHHSWASDPARQERELLRTAHLALGRLLELLEDDHSR